MLGIAIVLLYNLLGLSKYMSLGMMVNLKYIAPILASYSFTILGVLVAMLTLLFAVVDARFFKNFSSKGYLDLFFHLVFADAAYLIGTFIFSIASIQQSFPVPYIAYIFMLGSVFLTMFIIWILVGLFKEKIKEE